MAVIKDGDVEEKDGERLDWIAFEENEEEDENEDDEAGNGGGKLKASANALAAAFEDYWAVAK